MLLILWFLAEPAPEIPNPRSPLTPFFLDLYLGTTQGHCPLGPRKRLSLLASVMDPQRSV